MDILYIPDQKLWSRSELDKKKKQDGHFVKKLLSCKKNYWAKNTFAKKSKQICSLKMKAATKLHSNIKIFILQTYSGI